MGKLMAPQSPRPGQRAGPTRHERGHELTPSVTFAIARREAQKKASELLSRVDRELSERPHTRNSKYKNA